MANYDETYWAFQNRLKDVLKNAGLPLDVIPVDGVFTDGIEMLVRDETQGIVQTNGRPVRVFKRWSELDVSLNDVAAIQGVLSARL